MFLLQDVNLTELERALSGPRLGTYQGLVATTALSPLLGGYFWNLELSAALSPIVGTLEVALRNGIHQAASAHYATPDWFGLALRHAGDRQWLTATATDPTLPDRCYRPTATNFNKKKRVVAGKQKTLARWVSPAERKFTETKDRLVQRCIAPVPDQIVASVMFGFWLDLFHVSFEDPVDPFALWPACFQVAFPHTAIPDRAAMQQKLQSVKSFRNRLSHHEPVWKFGPAVTPLTAEADLLAHVHVLLELIGSVSPEIVLAFERTGNLERVRWLCSATTLSAFAATTPPLKLDHRQVNGKVRRALKDVQKHIAAGTLKTTRSISFTETGKPFVILTPLA